jgi:HAD superfamily hydrolase (TIGR01549 family)
VAIRAVLFDLFDTLVDLHMDGLPEVRFGGRTLRSTYGLLFDAARVELGVDFERFATALAEVDRELREVMHVQRVEVPTVRRFGLLLERLGAPSAALAERLTEVHMGRLAQQVEVLPHHVEVLARLRERARLGVCSNFTHTPTARRVLERAGLLPLLDAVVVSEEVGFRKPRPEIFRAALTALGSAPEETLHVGDNLAADVGGAAGVGMPSAWITRRVADPVRALREHAGPPPPHRVHDLAELVALLD